MAQPGGVSRSGARQPVGVDRGQRAAARQAVGAHPVGRVGRGVVELVRPVDEHGRRDADGGVGQDIVIGAAAERRLAVAHAIQERLAQPAQQVIGERGAGRGQAHQLPTAARLALVGADHVEVQPRDPAAGAHSASCAASQAKVPVISGGHRKRMPRRGGGRLPPAIRRARVAAVSISAAAPDPLSCAPGCGWHRWLTSRISCLAVHRVVVETSHATSLRPARECRG